MKNNIYATPQSEVSSKVDAASLTRVYSPTQVACGTLGGPVGLIYFLASNFESLGQYELKRKTLVIGIVLLIALVAILPFLPESFPSTPFTVVYILVARQVAEKFQMKKSEIVASEFHDFHSNWRVLGFGLLCLVGSAIAVMVPLFLLSLAGIWNPA